MAASDASYMWLLQPLSKHLRMFYIFCLNPRNTTWSSNQDEVYINRYHILVLPKTTWRGGGRGGGGGGGGGKGGKQPFN